MSTISRIRARVEARVAARLIPRLIDRGVQYHCRKKLRYWCNCNYCRIKIRGSREIAWVGQIYQPSPNRSYPDEWEIGAIIKAARMKKIQQLRLKLTNARED